MQVIAPLVDRAPEANTVQQLLLLRVRFLLCDDLVHFLELVKINPLVVSLLESINGGQVSLVFWAVLRLGAKVVFSRLACFRVCFSGSPPLV